ncbi:MAG TPA: hypothetical protein PKA57_03940 [Parvibaculum sp.]|uniref:hypothetical protein n=1 Tax=Parvibaculum sp. TaxID=2024848 RepID=UPI002BDCC53A|nr:hypothetical protein [Parvibaculum sp.]HMM13754.1 hypothetical protein [Parvibaculum sp.]
MKAGTFARGAAMAVLTVAAAALAMPAFAASMEPRFDNTMVGTRPDGTVLKLYYNRDHTFSGEITPAGSPTSFEAKGTWRLDGDKLCVTPETPGGEPGPEACAVLKGDKVGDKWKTTVQGTDGKPVVQTVEIVKGR